MEEKRRKGKSLKVSVCTPPEPVECLLLHSIDLVMMMTKVKMMMMMMMMAKMVMIIS